MWGGQPPPDRGGRGPSERRLTCSVPSLSPSTGGTNGIGLSVARTLYSKGAKVYVSGHQAEVGAQALEYIKTGNLEAAPEDYRVSFGMQGDQSGADGHDKIGEVEYIQYNAEDLNEVTK